MTSPSRDPVQEAREGLRSVDGLCHDCRGRCRVCPVDAFESALLRDFVARAKAKLEEMGTLDQQGTLFDREQTLAVLTELEEGTR